MQNLGTTLLKIVALASGTFLGILLVRQFDEKLSAQSHLDKNRYAQGLQEAAPKTTKDEKHE